MEDISKNAQPAVNTLLATCLFVIVSVLSCAFLAYAGEQKTLTPAEESSAWSVSVGAGALTTPEFEGSDKYKTRIMPHVSIEFMDRVFISTTNGLGVYIVNTPEWNMGVAANYNMGRKEKDSDLLRGMGDIDGSVTVGAFAAWTPQPFSVALEMDEGTGDVQGLRAKLSVGHSMSMLNCLQWENSVSATFADSRYNDTFFGVSRKQSRESRSMYDEYNAGSGIKDASFSSELTWSTTDNISTILSGQYTRLTGPAADSPLVQAGSKNQGSGMLGLVYTFKD